MSESSAYEDSGVCTPLFERLCTSESREEFLQHRARRLKGQELDELTAYITSDSCTEDLLALLHGEFDFPPARINKLRKSHSDRRRTIYIYPPRQNILMKYIIWGMHEYDGIFSDSLYSFRNSINTSHLFKKIARVNYARDLYTVKVDIRDYGHSIRQNVLLPQVEEIVAKRDPALFAFLRYLITKNECIVDGKIAHTDMGGLPGVPIGCFFNNVYLMELDSVMEERSALYSRYADDIAIFAATRSEAESLLAETIRIITRLGLTLNDEKTQIIAPGGSIELLGIQIQDHSLDVADTTKAKAKTKLTHYANKLVRWEQYDRIAKDEASHLMARRIDRYFYGDNSSEHKLSWQNFFFEVITRPDSLHELDLLCQDLLRRVATGKRGDARYRFRYEDIKALGYRPLVHEYYRHLEAHNK